MCDICTYICVYIYNGREKNINSLAKLKDISPVHRMLHNHSQKNRQSMKKTVCC